MSIPAGLSLTYRSIQACTTLGRMVLIREYAPMAFDLWRSIPLPNIDYHLALQHRNGQQLTLVIVAISSRDAAASNRTLASRASTMLRSEGLIPRSLAESNGILSWRGAVDGSTAQASYSFCSS